MAWASDTQSRLPRESRRLLRQLSSNSEPRVRILKRTSERHAPALEFRHRSVLEVCRLAHDLAYRFPREHRRLWHQHPSKCERCIMTSSALQRPMCDMCSCTPFIWVPPQAESETHAAAGSPSSLLDEAACPFANPMSLAKHRTQCSNLDHCSEARHSLIVSRWSARVCVLKRTRMVLHAGHPKTLVSRLTGFSPAPPFPICKRSPATAPWTHECTCTMTCVATQSPSELDSSGCRRTAVDSDLEFYAQVRSNALDRKRLLWIGHCMQLGLA